MALLVVLLVIVALTFFVLLVICSFKYNPIIVEARGGNMGNNELTGSLDSMANFFPTQFTSDIGKSIDEIQGGFFFRIALLQSNQVLSWGLNQFGVLGNGKLYSLRSPEVLGGLTCSKINSGSYHSLVITTNHQLKGFGRNFEGKLFYLLLI